MNYVLQYVNGHAVTGTLTYTRAVIKGQHCICEQMSDLSMNSETLQAQGTYMELNRLSQMTGTLTYTRAVIEGQHCIC